MKFDANKFGVALAKVKGYGFVPMYTIINPNIGVAGHVFKHPKTGVRIDVYPDGHVDRSGVLQPGWTAPAVDAAKVALKAEAARVQGQVLHGIAGVLSMMGSDQRVSSAVIRRATNKLRNDINIINRIGRLTA